MFVDVCVNLLLMLWHQMSGLVFLMSGQSDNLSWKAAAGQDELIHSDLKWVGNVNKDLDFCWKNGEGQKKGKFEQHANCIFVKIPPAMTNIPKKEYFFKYAPNEFLKIRKSLTCSSKSDRQLT